MDVSYFTVRFPLVWNLCLTVSSSFWLFDSSFWLFDGDRDLSLVCSVGIFFKNFLGILTGFGSQTYSSSSSSFVDLDAFFFALLIHSIDNANVIA